MKTTEPFRPADYFQPAIPKDSTGYLTKREYFAAMALASGSTPKEAVSKADELLKLLENE